MSIFSDDFNTESGLAPIWSLEGPVQGSAAITNIGGDAVLEISLPAGDFDIFQGEYNAARVLQDFDNTDFGVEASYLSVPSASFQVQGILAEQDSSNWIRFDLRAVGSDLKLFAAATTNNSTDIKFDFTVPSGAAQVLRMTRTGDDWVMEYSADGTNWTVAGSFTHSITVSGVGPFAASTGASPGYTAQLDYFSNTDSPIVVEDSNPANTAPVAMDDVINVDQDDSVTFTPGTNDSDADGDTVIAAIVSSEPSNGTATVNSDGSVTYTPVSGFDGADSFDLVVADGAGGFDTSTVNVTVAGMPDSPIATDDAYQISPAAASLLVDAAGGVLANDDDPDGDPLNAPLLAGPANGTVTLNGDGSFEYTPGAGFSGMDSFTYTVDDGTGLMDSGTVTITESSSAPYDVTIVSDDFNTSASLAPIWSLEGPSQGAAIITNIGSDAVLEISLPAGNFDIFNNEYNAARVLQDVEDTDFGVEASYLSSPTVASQVQGILIEQDADNWIRFDMRFAGGSERLFGAATVDDSTSIEFDFAIATGDAQFLRVTRTGDSWLMEYSADGSNWNAAGSFSQALNVTGVGPFAASTGASPGYTAQLDYFFNTASPIEQEDSSPANSAPIGVDDTVNLAQDDSITFQPGQNDMDANGNVVAAVGIETEPANGVAVANSDGSVTYTPNPGFDGTDTFEILLTDGQGGFDVSVVTADVAGTEDDPVAADDDYLVDPTVGTLTVAAAQGVLANDVDPDGDVLSATLLTGPSFGALNLAADGGFTYTPSAAFAGADSFTYTVDDGTGRTDTATVSIGEANPPPQLVTGTINFEKQVVDSTFAATHAVQAADFDGDGDIDLVSTSETTDTVAWLENDGNFNFTKNVIDSGLGRAYPVSIADMDGDGDIDVLASGFSADLHIIYENDGSGGFSRQQDIVQDGPHSIFGVDIDQDGDLDLLTSAQEGNMVTWYENDGLLNFTERTIDNDLQRAKTAIAHDVDGDGDVDVIGTSNLSDEVVWYENDGNQNWTKQVIDTNANGAYYAIGADLDGDGDQDIAGVSQTDSNVVWYRNDGNENFTKIQIEGFAAGARSIAASDIDADGDLDLFATARSGNYIAFYENDGAGNFTNRVVDTTVDGAYGIDIVDINLDGLLDIASAARDSGEISIHTQKRQHEVNVGLEQELAITTSLLQGVDANNDPSELVFTITTAPTAGDLLLNGVALGVGQTFTQEDIDLGLVSYLSTGTVAGTDGFDFTLSDGSGMGSTPIASNFIFNVIDFDIPVYDAPGEMVFNGTASTVLEVPHEQAFEVQEGTVAFAFTPADISGNQGLFAKDAAGFAGGGNHLVMYLQGGMLKVRAQDGSTSAFLRFEGIQAGTEYEVALTFGASGIELWIDGVSVDSASLIMDWSNGGNVQVTQWGGRGWGSASEATGFDAPYNGVISDKQIYGQVLDASQIAALANVSSGANNDPVAENDAITVAEDGSLNFDPTFNDSDADNDPLEADSIVTQASNGVAVAETDGTVTYTPNADFNGTDSFVIEVVDGLGGSDTSTVTVTVTPEADDPDAQDDTASTSGGTAVIINVLANDDDVDGDTVSVSGINTQATNGNAVVNGNGTIIYTPNMGFFGIDSFTYDVNDGTGGIDTATVNVSVVAPGNTPPVAVADEISVDEDQSINFQPGSNDTDVDGDTVIAANIAAQPSNGTAVVEANGTVTYTPNPDFNGVDTFDVTVTDQAGGADTETVTVTVNPINDDPVANDDAEVTTPTDPVIINLLDNDTDIDGDTLNIFSIGAASHGSVVDNGNGTITYTPTDPNFEGQDTFIYTVSDGTDTDTATVTVDINAFPDPIVDEPGVMVFDGTASSVMEVPHSADLEIEQGTIAFSFNADNTNGQRGLFAKDAAGFVGGGNHFAIYLIGSTLTARFQDGTDSALMQVQGIQANEDYDISIVFGPGGSELYVNGVLEGSDPLVMDWRQNVEVIQWGGRGWGSASGATGFDAPFDGTISDKQIYDVARNTAPVAVDDIISVLEDTFVTFNPASNDVDVDGDMIFATAVASDPTNGTAVVNPDGTVTYTPNAEYSGQDRFFVTVSDGNGGSDNSEVRITVNGQDDDPIAVDDTASTTPGQSVTIDVVANDIDTDGDDTLLVSSHSQGANGTVVNNGDGTVTYTPNNPTFEGTDTFTYFVTDGDGFPDEGTVTVDISPQTGGPNPIYSVDGITNFDGNSSSVINVAPTPTLEITEGTIAFSFIDDDTGVRQGLVTKDASDFVGGGHHFASYVVGDKLRLRFQDEDSSARFVFANLQDGQEYEVAAVFDENGIKFYVDGALIDQSSLVMDWTNNQQYMQIGGLGWVSGDGAPNFLNAFSGQIADVEIYDTALDAADIQILADTSSFDGMM